MAAQKGSQWPQHEIGEENSSNFSTEKSRTFYYTKKKKKIGVDRRLCEIRIIVMAFSRLIPQFPPGKMDYLFDSRYADFSGIVDYPYIFLSKAVHKAIIEIDEEGSEATATGMNFRYSFLKIRSFRSFQFFSLLNAFYKKKFGVFHVFHRLNEKKMVFYFSAAVPGPESGEDEPISFIANRPFHIIIATTDKNPLNVVTSRFMG